MIDRTEQEVMQNWEGDKSKPLVSICTITYNHGKYIAEALDSFLMQETNFPFEILIDDDCSPDNTVEVIKIYQKKYPNIINTHLREKNVGMIINFTENMQRAKGKYIAICEGDDYWTKPFKLQKQVYFLEKNSLYTGCFHDCIKIYEGGKNSKKQHLRINNRKIVEDVDLISIIDENNIATASIMFKNFIEKMPEYWEKTSKGDYALMIMIAEQGTIKYLPEVMSAYRIHSGGIWSTQSEIYKEQEAIKFYYLLQEYFSKDNNTLKALSRKLKYTYFSLSRKLVYNKQRLKSLYYLILSLDFVHHRHPNIKYYIYFKELIRSIIKNRRIVKNYFKK